MALCKFFRGKEEDLAQQPLTDGYVWVTNNNGVLHMYMDYIDENDELVRKQLNATDKQVRQIIANALKGSVGGETVLLEDVSPVEHTIKVQLSSEDITDFSNTTLTVSSENIIPFPYAESSLERDTVIFTVGSDGSIRIQGTYGDERIETYFNLFEGSIKLNGTFVLTGVPISNYSVAINLYVDGELVEPYSWDLDNEVVYYTINGNLTRIDLITNSAESSIDGGIIVRPYLAISTDTYLPTKDGIVELQSFSPTMAFSTNVEGVNIEVEYNKDINKAVSKNIVDGQGKESVQVFSGNAFADNSVAIGKNSVAGQKAYHIAAIDFTNHFIFLSNEKTTPVVLKSETEYAPYINTNFVSPEYSVGNNEDEEPDEFSLIVAIGAESWTHYHFIAKITSISNNVIGYDIDLPITELYENSEEYINTFFVASKPTIGAFNLMYGGFAEGEDTIASGRGSHAEGIETIAAGFYGHAEGRETRASYAAHSEGINTTASGIYSHAEGRNGIASGVGAHAEGYGAVVSGKYSHGEGNSVTVEGNSAHAEGESTKASANYSHAEGYSTTASAKGSHSEGRDTASSGEYSHAEGFKTKATMLATHSEGFNTSAEAIYSHAEGENTIAASRSQHVQGKWNIKDSEGKYAHIIGNGTGENSKANAHTVDWSGNAWFAGGITVGINNDKLVTEADIDAKLANYVSGSDVGQQSVGDHAEIFNDYENNSAFGPYAKASGYNTIAGITGYYFAKLELDDTNTVGVFYLSDTQYAEEIEDTSTLSKDFVINYAEGDVVSYISGSKYLDIGSITAIDHDNKIITVTATVEGSLKKGAFDTGVDDQILYVYAKPGVGIANFGHYAVAEGEETIAVERSSHAEGRQTVARGQYAHAEGRGTVANYAAHAEGYKSNALANYAHAEGYTTKAVAMRSHAEGNTTKAEGDAAHAEGTNTVASGIYSHAEGYATKSVGSGSHAEGNTTKAEGNFSHTEGQQTYAKGLQAHAEGLTSKALGGASHAEGQKTEASGERAHSEGYETIASGNQAHAEGQFTVASGNIAHAEGDSTIASGIASHTEGHRTEAVGGYAHAEGQFTKALKPATHAEGLGTVADSVYQHVQGKYNIEDGNGAYAHIVGNGNDDENRSNAHTLDWNGNAWFAGDVTLGKDNVSVTQTFNNITNDLTTRPTAEWAVDVATDLGNKEERISALEKLTSESLPDLDAQIQGNKASIELLGVDMYSMGQTSKQIFANTLKGSATGETITLKDTSPVEHIMGVKVRKKNLLPYPYRDFPDGIGTTEKYGVTISVDDKGVITLNGTCTTAFAVYLWRSLPFPDDIKIGDKLTISKGASDLTQGAKVTIVCNWLDADGKQIQGPQFNVTDNMSTTVKDNASGLNVYLYIQKDGVFDNLTLKPQIESGAVATGWTPYLAEDISTVKLNVLGKNLIDVFGRTKGTLSGFEASNKRVFEFDKYYVGLTANNYYSPTNVSAELVDVKEWQITSAVIGYGISFPFKVHPNTTYIGNANYSEGSFSITFYDEEGAYIKHVSAYTAFTVPDNCYIATLNMAPNSKNTMTMYSNIQIEVGTQKSECEPYKEPVEYAVNPDGTVTDVVSIYPSTTLTTDTIGAVIDCEYNRDINKAFAELANAIISLGGNI